MSGISTQSGSAKRPSDWLHAKARMSMCAKRARRNTPRNRAKAEPGVPALIPPVMRGEAAHITLTRRLRLRGFSRFARYDDRKLRYLLASRIDLVGLTRVTPRSWRPGPTPSLPSGESRSQDSALMAGSPSARLPNANYPRKDEGSKWRFGR